MTSVRLRHWRPKVPARSRSSSAPSRSRPASRALARIPSRPRFWRPCRAPPWRNGPTPRRMRATSTACSTPGPNTTRASATASTMMLPKLADAKLVGEDTFKNDDASIAAQITRIKSLPQEPDAIMLCTMMPGAVSAIKQIRAAGINSMILNGSGVSGSYWLSAVPDLSNFFVPEQGSVHGDDPNPKVNEFNAKYKEVTGGDPSSQYVYPGYVMIDVWAKAVERARHHRADCRRGRTREDEGRADPVRSAHLHVRTAPPEPGPLPDHRDQAASPRWWTSGRFRSRFRSTISPASKRRGNQSGRSMRVGRPFLVRMSGAR